MFRLKFHRLEVALLTVGKKLPISRHECQPMLTGCRNQHPVSRIPVQISRQPRRFDQNQRTKGNQLQTTRLQTRLQKRIDGACELQVTIRDETSHLPDRHRSKHQQSLELSLK